MGRIAAVGGGPQLFETGFVQVGGDAGEPVGEALEQLVDVAHPRSLPPAARLAATARRQRSARATLKVVGVAR